MWFVYIDPWLVVKRLFIVAAAITVISTVQFFQAAHSAQWWRSHPAEEKRMHNLCVIDPDGLGRSNACMNVR